MRATLSRLAVAVAVACLMVLATASVAVAQPPPFAQVPGSPFATGPGPRGMAFSSDGRLLATANNASNNVSVFKVGEGGKLIEVPGSPFDTSNPAGANNGVRPMSVAFSPDGDLLAAANPNSDTVSVFDVGEGGVLTQVRGSPFDTGEVPTSVVFSPDGSLLATANSLFPGSVSVFEVGEAGKLTEVSGSPFDTSNPAGANNGVRPISVAFSPDGDLHAAANQGAVFPPFTRPSVSMFEVGPRGRLTHVGAPLESAGFEFRPFSMVFSPDGRLLASANPTSDTVSLFKVGPGGKLTEVKEAFDTSNPAGGDNGRAPSSVAFSSGGGLLATANGLSDTASVFGVAGDPTLTHVLGSPFDTNTPTGVDNGVAPQSVAFSPIGGLLATANLVSDTVSVFASHGGLEIGKSADHAQVAPRRVLSYTLTVRNPNSFEVTGSITDDLAGVLDKATYQDNATATVGTAKVDTTTKLLMWSGTLASGQTATIHYSVKVHADAAGMLANRVSGPPGSRCVREREPDLPCVTRTPIVPPPGRGAGLVLSKTASTRSVHPGGQVVYTLAVHNRGPARATGVTVSDPVPPGLFLQSATPSPGGSCTIDTVGLSCQLGVIPKDGGAMVVVEATVAAGATGTITNRASVSANQHNPHPDNAIAGSAITVVPWPMPPVAPAPVSDLAVKKHVSHAVARVGQRLTYTITVANNGPDPASGVRLTDAASLPIKIVSIHTSHGSCQPGPLVICQLGKVNNGARVTVRVTAIATHAGHQVNTATATSSGWDPAAPDSLALARTRILAARHPKPPPPRVTG